METISFEDFKKLDLRVGKIMAAEAVTGSEKLVKLQVNLGAEIGERQIMAGIVKDYPPETLVGREIIVVVNLAPRKLMGMESQGMLLAAEGEGFIALLAPDKEVPPGAAIH
jgi:methionine--tRNA ligase beta chain